jgi:hypothetical protein
MSEVKFSRIPVCVRQQEWARTDLIISLPEHGGVQVGPRGMQLGARGLDVVDHVHVRLARRLLQVAHEAVHRRGVDAVHGEERRDHDLRERREEREGRERW